MNKLFLYILTFAVAVLSAGCDNYDNFYDDKYASVVRLSIFGENVFSIPASEPETVIDFDVLRSGYDIDRDATAVVRVMTDEEWQKYAATYGVQRYYKVPADCFKLGENGEVKMSFAPNDFMSEVALTVYSEKLGDYSATLPPPINEGAEWANVIVLPLKLEALSGSVYSDQSNLIIRLEYDENQ